MNSRVHHAKINSMHRLQDPKLLNAVIVNQYPSKLLNLQLKSPTVNIRDRST
jgi:hypothetical protein